MASVVNVNASVDNTGTTTHTVNLPASIVAGNLLVVFIAVHSAQTIGGTLTSEYTALLSPVTSHGDTFAIYYKTATGSEGATVGFTTGSNRRSSHASLQIQSWGDAVQISTGTSGTGTAIDPDSFTPSGITTDLTIAVCVSAVGQTGGQNFSGFPTDYDGDAQSESDDCSLAYAYRSIGGTEDPGAFTADVSTAWLAYTIGVEEGAAVVNPVLVDRSHTPLHQTMVAM